MEFKASSPLAQIDAISEILRKDGLVDKDKEARRKATLLARKLMIELEKPGDLIDRIIFQTQENAMLRLALDLGLYETLVQNGKSMSTEELAEKAKADPALMKRIMRNLAAVSHVDETGEDMFVANKITKAFTSSKGVNGAKFSHDFATPAWNQLSTLLKASDYRNPDNAMDGPVQRAFEPSHFFELLAERPDILNAFQLVMTSYREGRPEFLDIYPAEEQLINGFSEDIDETLFVDVGGGHGHEALNLVRKFPDAPGRKVLQELPHIIEQCPESNGIELMVNDFFTPQPIKDITDQNQLLFQDDLPRLAHEKCIEVLKQLIPAMTTRYSKLLINDIVMPNQGASRFATQCDINVMALLAAMERSEKQWHALLASVGLEITKIWTAEGGSESVIEAVLP